MHTVDIILIALAILAGINGYRRGALLQLASYGGLFVGILIAALFALALAGVFAKLTPTVRAVLAVVLFVACLAAGETAGFAVGRIIRNHMRSKVANGIDRALGVPIAATAVLLLAWIVAGIFIASPLAGTVPAVGYDIRQSSILQATSGALPQAEDALGPLRHFIGANQLSLPLPPFENPNSPPVQIDPALAGATGVRNAGASVFMVRGRACSQEIEGSGWVPKSGYLVTNAHVVAGVASPRIIQGPKSLDGTVTFFDAELDIAVLKVPGLSAAPLKLAGEDPAPRTPGATIGFPGGGKQVIAAAAVRTTASTRTTNIYGFPGAVREVVFFAGDVRPGSSGGALVDSSGTVIGVVFASSAVGSDDDYALAPTAVRGALERGTASSTAVSTGRCA